MMSWVALGAALVATSLGQVIFKLFFKTRNRLHLAAALFFFMAAPVGSYFALKEISIGVVYMSAGIIHVLVLLMSRYILQEKLTRDHTIAMLLIVSGLIIYGIR